MKAALRYRAVIDEKERATPQASCIDLRIFLALVERLLKKACGSGYLCVFLLFKSVARRWRSIHYSSRRRHQMPDYSRSFFSLCAFTFRLKV